MEKGTTINRSKWKACTQTHLKLLLNIRHCVSDKHIFCQVFWGWLACACEPTNGSEKDGLQNWQHHSWLNQYLFFSIKADFLCRIVRLKNFYLYINFDRKICYSPRTPRHRLYIVLFAWMPIHRWRHTHTHNQIIGPNANKYGYRRRLWWNF